MFREHLQPLLLWRPYAAVVRRCFLQPFTFHAYGAELISFPPFLDFKVGICAVMHLQIVHDANASCP